MSLFKGETRPNPESKLAGPMLTSPFTGPARQFNTNSPSQGRHRPGPFTQTVNWTQWVRHAKPGNQPMPTTKSIIIYTQVKDL